MNNIRVAITGATGLVGSHACEYLARKGYSVRAIIRSRKKSDPFAVTWSNLGIEIVEADINDKDKLEIALQGMDIVIHAAGIVDPYAPPTEISYVNVSGTRTVLETSINCGLKQFIFMSSLSVITGNNDQYNTDEKAPLVLCGESYADSKVKAEELVTSPTYKNKINVTVLRPGFIYGPGERAWLPQLIDAVKNGRAILIDGGKKQTNVINVENLNLAIAASILNEKAFGQVYNLTDGENISKKRLFDTISDEIGAPRIKKNLPGWLIKPIFDIISNVIKQMPLEKRKKLARFSKAAYRLIGINQSYSVKKAQEDLNYTNLIPFEIGMAKTLAQFKQTAEPAEIKTKEKVEIGQR